MKKFSSKKIFVRLFAAVAIIFSATALTSCYVDSTWNPNAPNGWNDTFYDQGLNGYWQLVEINGYRVTGYDVNFMYFNGRGRGIYYYYYNGRRMWENMAYWCQNASYGSSYYQININYESGSPTTMNYWLTDGANTLCMQWRNGNGLQTYVYARIYGSPW